jgi:hypothetical protein
MFETGIKQLHDCINRCQQNLTNQITKIGEPYIEVSPTHFLSTEYNATPEDLQGIQLYLLFLGDKSVFLSTYVIDNRGGIWSVKIFQVQLFQTL